MNYVQQVQDALLKEAERTGHHLDEQQLRLYTLLVLVKGTDTTFSDVHDAWAVGRNVDRPEHKDLIPFGKLTPDVIAYDVPFVEMILNVAAHRVASWPES